jgi:hypothetical protein
LLAALSLVFASRDKDTQKYFENIHFVGKGNQFVAWNHITSNEIFIGFMIYWLDFMRKNVNLGENVCASPVA